MKTSLMSCAGLLLACLATPSVARAAGLQQGPYVGMDLGVALTDDTRLKEFPGAPGGSHVEFDPGIRLSLGGGWRFSDWLRAGGQFGFISHSIDGADASFAHFPMLADIEIQLPNKSPIVPFIGGGPGISIATIAFDYDNLGGGDIIDGSTADAVFIWQAYAGLRYKISDTMSLGAVYKYSEADSTNWDVEGTATEIRFGRTRTHAISVSFSMDF